MKKKLVVYLVVGLLLFSIAFVTTGCPAPAADEPQPEPEPGDEEVGEIKIGGIFSLSGAFSPMGTLYRESLQLAVDEINAAGGVTVDGKQHLLRAYFRDDESSPDVSARRLRELNAEGIELFVGGTAAHLLSAMGEAAKAENSLIIGTTMPPDTFYEAGKHRYALCWLGSTNQVGVVGASWVANEFQPKRIKYLMPDYAYGHDSFAGAAGYLDANHPDIEYEVTWTPVGAPDFTPFFTAVRDFEPDVIVLGHWGADAINVLKQAHEVRLGDTAPIYFQGMISVFATAVDPDALAGVQFGSAGHHDLTGLGDPDTEAAAKEVTEKWLELTGKPPDAYGVGPWVALHEIVRGIELANSVKAPDVGEALFANPDFMTPKGPATWREDGRPVHKYFFFIFEGVPAAERADAVWDFGRVIGSVSGETGMTSLEDLGY